MGFPVGTSGKEPTCQCRRHKRCRFDPWVRKIPWRRKWQPTPLFLPKNPMDRGAWRAMVYGATNGWTEPKRLSTNGKRKLKRITRCIQLSCIGYIGEFTQITLKVLAFQKRQMIHFSIILVLSSTEMTVCTSPFMKQNKEWQGQVTSNIIQLKTRRGLTQ